MHNSIIKSMKQKKPQIPQSYTPSEKEEFMCSKQIEYFKKVLTICPGFASDCVETLEEIQIQAKESFLNSGGENFDMVPCLNDNNDHINLLTSLIERNI